FMSFREEIEQRIIDLDEFYQMNINDSRISQFEKIRNRLSSLLEINIESGNAIMKKDYGNINDAFNLANLKNNDDESQKSNTKPNQNLRLKSKWAQSSANMRHSTVKQSSASKMFGE
ncbi:MAG: hypothetical protein ACRC42_02475, partial [Mycoplasma sp.]